MDEKQQKAVTAAIEHMESHAMTLKYGVLNNLDTIVGDGKGPVDLGQLDKMVKKTIMQIVTKMGQDRINLLHTMRPQGGENGCTS